jgi:hypothetical protein
MIVFQLTYIPVVVIFIIALLWKPIYEQMRIINCSTALARCLQARIALLNFIPENKLLITSIMK